MSSWRTRRGGSIEFIGDGLERAAAARMQQASSFDAEVRLRAASHSSGDEQVTRGRLAWYLNQSGP